MCKFLMTLIILKAAVIPFKCGVASGGESLLELCTNVNRKSGFFFSGAELRYTVTAGCCIIMGCTHVLHQV